LVAPNAHPDYRKTIKRSSLIRGMPDAATAFVYTLPYHKGDRLYTGTYCPIVASADKDMCAARLLDRYIAQRDGRWTTLAPYLFITECGAPPTRSWYLKRLAAFEFGENVGGHSLRAGGATYHATLGWSGAWIRRLGRWSSTAFETYIRHRPQVMALLRQAETDRLARARPPSAH
jgi:hypothetical protein